MASRYWVGGSPAISQVSSVTIQINDVSTQYILQCNGKQVSVNGQAGGNAVTAAALANAVNESVIAEFREIEASNTTGSPIVILTAREPGKPFTVTSSTSGGIGTISPVITSVPSSGPSHWDTATNWMNPDDLNNFSIPQNGDDVFFRDTDSDILYGLQQGSVTLNSMNFSASFTGRIGLPLINEDNPSLPYGEYRPSYLRIGSNTVTIGHDASDGFGLRRLKLDTGPVKTTIHVFITGSSSESNLEAFLWKGTHAENMVNVYRGSFGAAVLPGEVATILTLNVGYEDNIDSDAQVRCLSGVTLNTVQQTGGNLITDSNISTKYQSGGTHLALSGNFGSSICDFGRFIYRGTGTLTSVNLGSGAILDFSQDMRTRTITNTLIMNEGSVLLDPFGTVTYSNGIKLVRCTLAEVNINVGHDRTISIS